MKPFLNWSAVPLGAVLLAASFSVAFAHTSNQAFVLLLPTDVYIMSGVAAVALTIALLAVPGLGRALGNAPSIALGRMPRRGPATLTSLGSLAILTFLIVVGLFGSRDPLINPLPLFIWTVWWIGFVMIQAVLGDLWYWVNPWTGLYQLIGPIRPLVALPKALGVWPVILLLIGFAAFILADIAPDDPARLAHLVSFYWLLTMTGMILCGPAWLRQVELGSVIFSTYSSLAAARLRPNGGIGFPGWRLLERAPMPAGGIFALTLLAVGSFDGLNETFWWLAKIGINPLAFPGRSAVVWPTLLGLIGAIIALIIVFAATVWLGLLLSPGEATFADVFGRLALSVLPIALAYHIAHYLTAFLVNGQYALAALSDPLASGADLLGIQPFYVTTGFFNHIDSVRMIWLTQAGAVVVGHVRSVLLAHRMVLDLFSEGRRAALATLPLSLFMIAYTMFGLWLLATPKGA